MAQVINTNSLSLLTQNNLNKSQSSLSSAIERLSSGLRINSAKDDAAGQAIANRFTSNIKGLTQASRNANDGISIAQTTEGSLSEINNNLQRVRELSVQATNGTNSKSDLESIQAEITQRLSEIDRVSGQTQFNGVKVLASNQTMKIQVGANDGETIEINLQEITSSTLGLGNLNVTNKGLDLSKLSTTALTDAKPSSSVPTVSHTLTAKDTAATNPYSLYVDDADANIVYASNNGTDFYKVSGYDKDTGVVDFNGAVKETGTITATKAAAGQNVNIDGTTVVNADSISLNNTAAAATTSFSVDKDGQMYVKVGSDIFKGTVDLNTGIVSYKSSDAPETGAAASEAAVTTGDVIGSTTPAVKLDLAGITGLGDNPQVFSVKGGGYVIKGTENDADAYYSATIKDDGTVVKGDKLNSDPMASIDKALAQVDSLRSDLGAVQNRFDSAITNLGNTVNNLSSARSRIEDADYATEVSNMSRAQILQQAGTSVLAQANQTTQNVLSLLR
ncbi:flagellin N-terminal helical domain-containing protein [Citrobacter telavivensis]